MKTVGNFLKDHRQNAGLSLDQIAGITKIRLDYLEAIEQDKFDRLPSAAFVKGFIRSYALAVKLDPEKALAIFRRDFDQNQLGRVVPRGMAKPLNVGRGLWNPRTTTILSIVLIIAAFLIYGLWQIVSLVAAPNLEITSPVEAAVYLNGAINLSGKTQSDAAVYINEQPVVLSGDGSFETTINLDPGEHLLIFKAVLRNGKQTEVTRRITIEPPPNQ